MKKVYLLIAAAAVLLTSCAKETVISENQNAEPQFTGRKITFSASIEMNGATKADLDGLALKWTSSDHVFVAADNNATLQDVTVTPDATDATQCTIEVEEVSGASTYYFLYTGRSASDNITFDTSTKTFSGFKYTPKDGDIAESFVGLGVGNQQVGEGTVDSNNYYGAPLSMAGKATATSATVTMIPCLALVKLKVGEASTKYKYEEYTYHNTTYNKDHTFYCSGVRGFQLTQKGFSRSSGAYSVNLSGDDMVVSPVTSLGDHTNYNKQDKAYRDVSHSALLSKDTEYMMCLIPGGSISGFDIFFYGYTSTEANSWDAMYPMSLSKSLTVKPGDYINLGTLDPVTLQKAKNKDAADAADELEAAAASFTPAIEIDGSFDDWDPAQNTAIAGKMVSISGGTHYQELKVAYDSKYIYFYTKRDWDTDSYNVWSSTAYIYYGFDLDNNASTAMSDPQGMPGADAWVCIYPFNGSSSDPQLVYNKGCLNNWNTYSFTDTAMDGVVSAGYLEFEIKFLRTDITNGSYKISDGNTINCYSFGNKSGSDLKTTAATITISD